MRSRRLTVAACAALACAALAVAPGAALAAPQLSLIGGGTSLTHMSIPVRVTGLLSVQFHGDAAAGCARWGLCGYDGTVSWQPPPTASLTILRTNGRHPSTDIELLPDFSSGPAALSGVTSASVTLAGNPSSAAASRCIDATGAGQGASFSVRHGRVTFSLADESPLLLTRCAGPRDDDVLPHLPAPVVSMAALKRGHTTISLAASHPLQAHGFVGSVTSTVALHLGRPGRARTENDSLPLGKTQPGREIAVTYRGSVSGNVVEDVRGAANPLECGPVGSCGLKGTITLSPHATAFGALVVEEKATVPRRRLLAAVGLAPGSPGNVVGLGFVGWRGGGTVTSDLSQGAERCRDTTRAGPSGVIMVTSRSGWAAGTFPGGLLGAPGASTRCPGPTLSTGTISSDLTPLSWLDQRTIRVTLTNGSTVHDNGYGVQIVPYLTLTLTRLKVRTKAVRILTGGF